MTAHKKEEDLTPSTVFELMQLEADANVLAESVKISKQSEAIRRLEEITQQVDSPYIGSYSSA